MLIRFFNDIDPADPQKERLLIGISAPDSDRGQAREAVRVATEEDVELYAAAYTEYQASFEEAGKPADEAQAGSEERHSTEEGPQGGLE